MSQDTKPHAFHALAISPNGIHASRRRTSGAIVSVKTATSQATSTTTAVIGVFFLFFFIFFVFFFHPNCPSKHFFPRPNTNKGFPKRSTPPPHHQNHTNEQPKPYLLNPTQATTPQSPALIRPTTLPHNRPTALPSITGLATGGGEDHPLGKETHMQTGSGTVTSTCPFLSR